MRAGDLLPGRGGDIHLVSAGMVRQLDVQQYSLVEGRGLRRGKKSGKKERKKGRWSLAGSVSLFSIGAA